MVLNIELRLHILNTCCTIKLFSHVFCFIIVKNAYWSRIKFGILSGTLFSLKWQFLSFCWVLIMKWKILLNVSVSLIHMEVSPSLFSESDLFSHLLLFSILHISLRYVVALWFYLLPFHNSFDVGIWLVFFLFSTLRQRADPVYSPPLQVSGLCWRLKVYPVSFLYF